MKMICKIRKIIREEVKKVLTEKEMEGGWISPTNEMVSIGSNSHSYYAYRNPHEVGIGSGEFESLKNDIKNESEREEASRNLAMLNGAVSYRVVQIQGKVQLVLIGTKRGIKKSLNKIIKDFRRDDMLISVLIHKDVKFDSYQEILNLPIENRYKTSLKKLRSNE